MTDPVIDAVSTSDDDSPGLRLFAKLGVAIETMTDAFQKTLDAEQRRLAMVPVSYPFQQIVNTAGATDVKDFAGPSSGRVWNVRLLTAYASPVAANAAVVSWYVGQIMPGDIAGQLPLSMKRWEFSALPAQKDLSPGQITLRSGERLIAGITGIPASSRIFLNVSIDDEPLWGQRFAISSQ